MLETLPMEKNCWLQKFIDLNKGVKRLKNKYHFTFYLIIMAGMQVGIGLHLKILLFSYINDVLKLSSFR